MSDPRVILFIALAVTGAAFLIGWARSSPEARRGFGHAVIGFVTNFFDTLGIGSYAPTTALFRFFKMVPDEKIPGTLTLGHTLPTIVQSFIFIAIVSVDFKTLFLLIGAAVVGAWLGAGVVARWPRRNIQIGMGFALVFMATLFTLTNLDIVAAGGSALGLSGTKLIIGIVGNFVLGALMTLGIGLYGPCIIMISLLGMDPRAAFPIMMASCAFLMPVAALRFARAKAYEVRPALGLLLGGLPAVVIAALIVKSMELKTVRWLVVVVVLVAAAGLLWSAFGPQSRSRTAPPPVAE